MTNSTKKRVLSLFDGISCARVAIGECEYYSSEIDKYANQVSHKNFPDIIRLGDVTKVQPISDLFLLIGGSPCQDLSIAKKGRQGLQGDRSGLFYEYVRILRESKPKYFILENVASMSKESRDAITKEMGVEPIMINASLVSAQSRKRLFWTNIPVVGLPKDRGILLKDILQDAEVDERMVSNGKAYTLTATYNGAIVENSIKRKQRTMVISKPVKLGYVGKGGSNDQGGQALRVYDSEGKSVTLGSSGAGLIKTQVIRKLTPIECERLQSLPDNYTEGISTTQRYKCLGNAFNVDVIRFILSYAI